MYKQVDHPERNCLWCDNIFKPNRKDKQFCSKTCYKLHGKKHKGHSNGDRTNFNDKQRQRKRPYIAHRKLICERCGFVPEHPCQLDVDHIDGNHQNNSIENLQTLCACCHRLKTAEQLGWYK